MKDRNHLTAWPGRAAAKLLPLALLAAAFVVALAGEASAVPCETIDLTLGAGSELDLGWTGYAHDQPLLDGATITLRVVHRCSTAATACFDDGDCPGGETCDPTCDCDSPASDPECEIYGPVAPKRCVVDTDQQCQIDADCPINQRCVDFFSPPLPLSAAGTPTCVASFFEDDITGTLDLVSGRVETSAALRSRTYLGINVTQPCPVCGTPAQSPAVGDSFTCDGGPRDGLACTVDGVNALFGGASFNCPPNPAANVSGTGTAFRLDRLTTESQTLQATLPCGGAAGDLHPAAGNALCLDNSTACTTNADCLRCTESPSVVCTTNSDCTGAGVCAAAPEQPVACGVYCHCGFCDGDPQSPCNSDAQCDVGETCEQSAGSAQQALNNPCDSLICGMSSLEQCCAAGDPDCVDPTSETGKCSLAPYYPCGGDPDCASLSAGTCVFERRQCFENTITRNGVATPMVSYTMQPTLNALICTAPTLSAGTNAANGVPGPATLSLVTTLSLDGDGEACLCGNGAIECAEHCDDGNVTDGDGCDSNCTETGCPNGVATAGEACDDGDAVNGDGCDTNCTVSECGNGIGAPGEQCDDGNLDDGDGCDSNCTFTVCGNGILTTSTGEQCDDGNTDDGDGCSTNCLTEPAQPCLLVSNCIQLGAKGRASLQITNDDTFGKDKLKWKWTNGEESAPADFGDPTSTVSYTLCLIDSGNVAASYDVAPSGTLWSINTRDTKYRDKAGSQAGITSIKLRPGIDGRARIGVQAAGDDLLLPAPFSPGQMFHQAPSVTVRLINSLGRCWDSDFPVLSATRNSAERFQAKVP